MTHRLTGAALVFALVLALVLPLVLLERSARAEPRATYATEAELPSEGLHHLVSTAILGTYARTAAGRLRNSGGLAVRNRLFLGNTVGYVVGLDADLGGSNAGLAYGATAHVLGIGARWAGESTLTLSGGVGYDRVGDAVPGAAKLPVELALALTLGPVRPTLFVRPQWILSESARRDGAGTALADELEAGLLVRLARQHRYWGDVTAGGGLALGIAYRRFLDTSSIVAMLGIELEGGR